jgi:hypothetical protein
MSPSSMPRGPRSVNINLAAALFDCLLWCN